MQQPVQAPNPQARKCYRTSRTAIRLRAATNTVRAQATQAELAGPSTNRTQAVSAHAGRQLSGAGRSESASMSPSGSGLVHNGPVGCPLPVASADTHSHGPAGQATAATSRGVLGMLSFGMKTACWRGAQTVFTHLVPTLLRNEGWKMYEHGQQTSGQIVKLNTEPCVVSAAAADDGASSSSAAAATAAPQLQRAATSSQSSRARSSNRMPYGSTATLPSARHRRQTQLDRVCREVSEMQASFQSAHSLDAAKLLDVSQKVDLLVREVVRQGITHRNHAALLARGRQSNRQAIQLLQGEVVELQGEVMPMRIEVGHLRAEVAKLREEARQLRVESYVLREVVELDMACTRPLLQLHEQPWYQAHLVQHWNTFRQLEHEAQQRAEERAQHENSEYLRYNL